LIFAEVVENQAFNLWKTIYCPNHWVIVTNTQQKMHFAQLVSYNLKFWKIKIVTAAAALIMFYSYFATPILE
jgi:hypothetical protein